MHFPKLKMVDKIQYGNYHEELSCYFGFKSLVLLSDREQIVQTFDRRKNYNAVKIDGKIRFREDIDAFITMHKIWSQSLKPGDVAEIPENILPESSLMLLEGRDNACHKKVTLGS